jgi:hypothetical protein
METPKMTDYLIVAATLLSPLIALQVQRWLDRIREVKAGRLWVFRTLMATRAARISPQHVEALNMIDVAFYERDSLFRRVFPSKANKRVREAWKEYLDHLGTSARNNIDINRHLERRDDLFVQLLYDMALAVGYDFDKTHIKNNNYSPIAHGKTEEEMNTIRQKLVEILSGNESLKMEVTSFPPEDESQRQFREQYVRYLQTGRPWPVQIVENSGEPRPEG